MQVNDSLTDTVLLNEAFVACYERMLRWCQSRTTYDAEDLVHAAYLRCEKSWRRRKSANGTGEAYFFLTLRSVLIDEYRKRQRRLEQFRDLCEQFRIDEAGPQEAQATFLEAIGNLPERLRSVCQLVLDGMSVDRIAETLCIPRATVAVYLSRAKSLLKLAMLPDVLVDPRLTQANRLGSKR